jgi:CheY-like chemotaxis protein
VLAATVLVADDDADILRFVEINLRLEGFEVVTARDGPDALAKAAAVRPDLVLLDVQMPGIDGYTICARIRADASLAAVRVIMVTANYGSADVQAARRAGADDFLVKPFLPAAPRHDQGHAQLERATASPNLPAAWPLGGVVRPRSWRSAVRQPRRGPAGHSRRHSTGRNQIEPLVTGQTRLLT